MPTAQRYYLIADDGKIHRLARTTFYKLLEQKIPTPFPEFNGKRVKLATVNVERFPIDPDAVSFSCRQSCGAVRLKSFPWTRIPRSL